MALVNYTGKNVFGICLRNGEIFRFMPGINEVETEKMNEMKDLILFQSRIEKGLITILREELDKDGKRTVNQMLESIPKIFDIRLLKKIIETDGRPQVIKIAQKQLDDIKNPSKAKEEKEDADHYK